MRGITTILILLAAVMSASTSYGHKMSECSGALPDHNFSESAHLDWKKGFVSYILSHAFSESQGSTYVFENCKTGESLKTTVMLMKHSEAGFTTEFDRTNEYETQLQLLFQSPRSYTFDDLVNSLRLKDFNSRTSIAKTESCSCHAEYQFSRGKKVKFWGHRK